MSTDGLTVSRSSSQDIVDLEHLLATRGVVVFRDQDLSIEQQVEFGAKFGPLHVHHSQQVRYIRDAGLRQDVS